MSVTYSLVCHETKQKLWIGQGAPTMSTFYYGIPEKMELLGKFLSATIGKPLVVEADAGTDADLYEEFGEGST